MTKKIRLPYFIVILFTVLLTSCFDDGFKDMDLKPEATGTPGRIIVVLDKPYWESDLGDAIRQTIGKPVEFLPQEEPIFDYTIVDNASLTSGMRTNHTIIIFDVDKSMNTVAFNFNNPSKDIWAKNQTVYRIAGGTTTAIAEQYMRYAPTLIHELENSALSVLKEKYAKHYNKATKEELEITMKLSLNVPVSMAVAENFNDFVWMQQIKALKVGGLDHEVQQGVFVYTYPFIDDSTFTLSYQINKRDSLLKKYVHGKKEGTYMQTEKLKGFEPIYTEKTINGDYAFEMKGLWKMQNSLMGGAFISVSRVDKKRNRVVTVEGYVYAPDLKKQPYLRELQAMIYSLEFL